MCRAGLCKWEALVQRVSSSIVQSHGLTPEVHSWGEHVSQNHKLQNLATKTKLTELSDIKHKMNIKQN